MSLNFLICCGKTVCLMNEALSTDEAVTRFGLYVGTTCGDSMEPMIRQGRDRVCIGRCSGRLRLYDVPLYRRSSGQLVLHRIVKVLPEEYVTCGDNRRKRERGVTDAMIIGILTGFYREGIFIDCRRSWKYRCYVFFWWRFYWLRLPFLLGRDWLHRRKRYRKSGRSDFKPGLFF